MITTYRIVAKSSISIDGTIANIRYSGAGEMSQGLGPMSLMLLSKARSMRLTVVELSQYAWHASLHAEQKYYFDIFMSGEILRDPITT